jgi:predicted unusual protein kinase regulating ubiquinone biosynthesis (AarF/ABC1/UbiB family)
MCPAASDVVGDIRSSIINEVDFRKEAEHLQARSDGRPWL